MCNHSNQYMCVTIVAIATYETSLVAIGLNTLCLNYNYASMYKLTDANRY